MLAWLLLQFTTLNNLRPCSRMPVLKYLWRESAYGPCNVIFSKGNFFLQIGVLASTEKYKKITENPKIMFRLEATK